MSHLKVGLAQINTTVGDLNGNANKIKRYIKEARSMGLDLLTFPELSLTGYPLNDLLFDPHFLDSNMKELEKIIVLTQGITVVVGLACYNPEPRNSAAIIRNGELLGFGHKKYLQNYGDFDERRYLQPGPGSIIFRLDNVTLGLTICDDIWWHTEESSYQEYLSTVELLINISASRYHPNKYRVRKNMLSAWAANNVTAIVFTNLVGKHMNLELGGGSMVIDHRGRIVTQANIVEEELVVADINVGEINRTRFSDQKFREHKCREKVRKDSCQPSNRIFVS